MGSVRKSAVTLQFWLLWVCLLHDVSVGRKLNQRDVCTTCNDAVNSYCCKYEKKCCEYVGPDGCPPPAGPDAKAACRYFQGCQSSADCANLIPRGFRQCCSTSLCGATCILTSKPPSMNDQGNNKTDGGFAGYRY